MIEAQSEIHQTSTRLKDAEIATGGGEAPASLTELPSINVTKTKCFFFHIINYLL